MSKIIWSSNAQRDYYGCMNLEELKKEYEDNFDDEEVNGVPIEEASEEDFLDFFLPDEFDVDKEDLEESILPVLNEQCYNNIMVFFGKAANWEGYHEACLAKDINDVDSVFYPDFDANTEIYVSNGELYFGESSHDVPMGFSMSLYSFKTKEDFMNAEKELLKIDSEFDMDNFLNEYNYPEIKMLIEKGILTPIKNTINNYTGNEKEEN